MNYIQHCLIDSDNHRISTAFALFRQAAQHKAASIKKRLTSALQWLSATREHPHESLFLVYSMELKLFNRYVVASPNIERQLGILNVSIDIPQSP
jgi:hypothetical protein